MNHSSNLATRTQAQASVYEFLVTPDAFKQTNPCQTATSYLGLDPSNDRWTLCSITCKRWSCPACARVKIKRLGFLVHNAKPNRLLTLTTDPAKWENPRAAFEGTAKQVPELIRSLRNDFGPIDYFRVTECTAKGWPHYHLLVRSGFIPHTKIKSQWATLANASIVDVRRVSESFACYTYLVKYLSKLHRIEWTERHVSYSRGFFNPEDLEKFAFPPLEQGERIDKHPTQVLAAMFPDETVQMPSDGRYLLPHKPLPTVNYPDRTELGLASEQAPMQPRKKTQSFMIETGEPAKADFHDQSF